MVSAISVLFQLASLCSNLHDVRVCFRIVCGEPFQEWSHSTHEAFCTCVTDDFQTSLSYFTEGSFGC